MSVRHTFVKKKYIRKFYLFKMCFRTSGTPKKNLTTNFFFYCPSVGHTFVGWVLKKIEKIDVFKMCFRTSGTPKKNLTSYFFFTPSVCLSTLQCFWHPVNFWHPVANSCDFLKSLGKKKLWLAQRASHNFTWLIPRPKGELVLYEKDLQILFDIME